MPANGFSQFPSRFLVLGVFLVFLLLVLLKAKHPMDVMAVVQGRRDVTAVTSGGAVQMMGVQSEVQSSPPVDQTLPTQLATSSRSSQILPPSQKKLNYLREHSVSHSLLGLDLEAMDDTSRVLTINSFLDNVDAICKRKIRMGHLADGGWEMCDDEEVRPVPPCIVYSFGINRDWSFDDDVSTLYGCHVYAFDPSIDQETHNRTDHIHFYKWGLAGKAMTSKIGWQLYSFQDIRRKLGHADKTIDVIKMDIERAEWGALPNMVETGQFEGVKQFLIEYHVSAGNKLEQLQLYQQVEKLGFGKFDVHKNEHCADNVPGFPVPRTRCYEVHYMRVKGRPIL